MLQQLNWQAVQALAQRKAKLLTKTGVPFHIVAASEDVLTVRVRSYEEHTVSRNNLEKAVAVIQSGTVLNGPKDYKDLVADDRPAYAWAILRELGLIE